MIARLTEIERSVLASISLLRSGDAALRSFDFSVGGFWRSFAAAIFVYPVAVLIYMSERKLWTEQRADLPLPDLTIYLTTETGGFIARWALFTLAMVLLCRQLNLTKRFVPLMVVFNWSSVVVAALLLPATVLYNLDLISADVAKISNFVAFFLAILYRLRIAELTLKLPPFSAIVVPLLYVVINIGVKTITSAVHLFFSGGG